MEHLPRQNIRLFHIVTNDETLMSNDSCNVNWFQITVECLFRWQCADIYEDDLVCSKSMGFYSICLGVSVAWELLLKDLLKLQPYKIYFE